MRYDTGIPLHPLFPTPRMKCLLDNVLISHYLVGTTIKVGHAKYLFTAEACLFTRSTIISSSH